MKFKLLFIILFWFITIGSFAQKNVIIVVLDGARYTETFGDSTHRYIPFMWNKLRPLGTIFTQFYNNGVTVTNPGHSTILSGTWQDLENDGSQRPTQPTIFEYFRKQNNAKANEAYVILGKNKLDMLTYSSHPEYGQKYGASVTNPGEAFYSDDKKVFENFKQTLSSNHPRLVLVNMPRTDGMGHSGVFKDYTIAIKQADSLIFEMWKFVQKDKFYKNKTTFIVTNDHGRHCDACASGFITHGDKCEGCRHIMLLALGKDIAKNHIDDSMRQQIDIAPTVGKILGFKTEYSIGKIIYPISSGNGKK